MIYKATVFMNENQISCCFETLEAAEKWLDYQNKNHNYTTLIERYSNIGLKVDSFYYTGK